MGQHVGYIRVSTAEQNTGRQLEGVELDKTFTEKISGKDTNRPQLQAALEYCREGDTLHVHELSRLGRSIIDLDNLVEQFRGNGVTVVFHKEGMTFTPGEQDDPMKRLMFDVLSSFAKFERSIIRQRQAEGIAARKAAGKPTGRPGKLTDQQKAEIREKRKAGVTPTALAREYGISRATIYSVK